MSTVASHTSAAPLGLRPSTVAAKVGVYRARRSFDGARGLSAMLLAAVVAALVVLADRLVSTWADGHLLLAWVFLWVVIFAGLALFAGTARSLAGRMLRWLDSWSQSLAEARAEARLWDMARHDPRLMGELMQARMRAADARDGVVAVAAAATDFSEALAPLGLDTDMAPAVQESAWDRFVARMIEQRSRNIDLHYI